MPSNDETGNGKRGLVVSRVNVLGEVIREEIKIRAPMSISVVNPDATEMEINALSTRKGRGEGGIIRETSELAGNDVHRH